MCPPICGALCGNKPEQLCLSGRHQRHTAAFPEAMPVVPPHENKRGRKISLKINLVQFNSIIAIFAQIPEHEIIAKRQIMAFLINVKAALSPF